ncbi:ferrochelatase [Knoellia subterranea]|uniref:Coproporphyrin III ferrochelatase n=1 Tax=Knoellia subterranea KCTC 19937 TaxID=1385521 RepID=A0A0A0JMA8_9MICO|nr:ferrochelatase [Knoellia subterranea]KGN38520.1 ferrochelatase [Knoellia subterranea KCTC 19937]
MSNPSVDDALTPYDAVLLLSFGGPEAPEEVVPFLRRVTAGRDVPEERLEEVAKHYHHFGGRSPINDQNRELLAAIEAELARRDESRPVLWGNRNSDPFLTDTLRAARAEGHLRICVVVTSAYSSYSGCRQYREDLAAATDELGLAAVDLQLDKIRPYALHPGFVAANLERLVEAVGTVDPKRATTTRLLFVTHSVPDAMDDTSGPGDGDGNLYIEQHLRAGHLIAQGLAERTGTTLEHELVFCSRSGSPRTPWLEPDINDRLAELAAGGVTDVVVAPIGFVSDHMEVVNDLDREARESAERLGLGFVRVPTAGTHPLFVEALVDLVEERAAEARDEVVVPAQADSGDVRPSICDSGCCPNLREARPALCGRD